MLRPIDDEFLENRQRFGGISGGHEGFRLQHPTAEAGNERRPAVEHGVLPRELPGLSAFAEGKTCLIDPPEIAQGPAEDAEHQRVVKCFGQRLKEFQGHRRVASSKMDPGLADDGGRAGPQVKAIRERGLRFVDAVHVEQPITTPEPGGRVVRIDLEGTVHPFERFIETCLLL